MTNTSTSPAMSTPAAPPNATPTSPSAIQIARSVMHLSAVIALSVWGFVSWPLPLPGVFTGIGFTVAAVLIWALFLSPSPVLKTDRFGQALVELLLIAAAVGALLGFGVPWFAAVAYGAIAAVIGYAAGSRANA